MQEQVVSSPLHARYCAAAQRILKFWSEHRETPKSWDDFDLATSAWLEHLFAEGFPKGYGSDGLAALQHFLPELAGKLRHSWRLLRTWQKFEPPVRVLPISPLMVVGLSGLCVYLGWPEAATAFLVAFDALLRPGELYKLRVRDLTWASGQAVLTLANTKTGIRKGANEMVLCESAVTNKWLLRVTRDKHPDALLLDRSPQLFRSLFFNVLDLFSIRGNLSMYSFRRGGATWHFLGCQSLESTLLRGRWQSTATARIYLQDAAASLSRYSLTPSQQHVLRRFAAFL